MVPGDMSNPTPEDLEIGHLQPELMNAGLRATDNRLS